MSEILSSVARRSCGGSWRSVPLPLASWTGPPRRPLDVVGRCAAGVQVLRQLRANRFAYHDACLLGPAGAGVGGALKVLALLFSFVCKRPGRYHLWLTCWRLLRLHEWVTFVAVNGWRSGKGGVPLMACRRRDGVDRGGDLTVLRRRGSLRGPHRARRSAPSDGSVIERERRRERAGSKGPRMMEGRWQHGIVVLCVTQRFSLSRQASAFGHLLEPPWPRTWHMGCRNPFSEPTGGYRTRRHLVASLRVALRGASLVRCGPATARHRTPLPSHPCDRGWSARCPRLVPFSRSPRVGPLSCSSPAPPLLATVRRHRQRDCTGGRCGVGVLPAGDDHRRGCRVSKHAAVLIAAARARRAL